MKLKIEFDTDNAAFNDQDDPGLEIRRILLAISFDITDVNTSGPVRDSNGNTIGAWSWK